MEIVIQPTPQAASITGARVIANIIKQKPNAVLGLATGSTPLFLYKELIRLHKEEGLDFSHVTTFNLDEYIGLSPEHPASYHYFMQENFFRHVNVKPDRIFIPDGQAKDIPLFCKQYEEKIQQVGGIDVQVLGIGTDGHIGFNEPTSSLASRTRIKTLTEQTLKDNMPFFSNPADMPSHVITMGVGTIMDVRTVLLFAFGEKKAQAIAEAVEGPIMAMNPASVLQLHQTTKLFIDKPAAGKLKKTNYYNWVYENKPNWQQL
jgi:glucosamine-6-phosphate deaminase